MIGEYVHIPVVMLVGLAGFVFLTGDVYGRMDERRGYTGEKAYQDRNLLAVAFAQQAVENGYPAGIRYGDDTDDEWRVVWVQLPTREVSWHVPAELVQAQDTLKPNMNKTYSGYDRETKNQRLREHIEGYDSL